MNLIESNNISYNSFRQNYNYGIGLLKVYLAFTVVISHCCIRETVKNKFIFFIFVKERRIHVPSFFIMAFYFMNNNFVLIDYRKLFIRLERLIIPYFGWPIIIYILNNLILHQIIKNNNLYSFKDLINQLLWGNIFIIQFWFQWDLIMITIFFYLFIFIFEKYHLFGFQLLAIFAYFLQYSEYNLKFYLILKPENKECLGRIAEVFPFCVTGYSLSSLKVIDFLNYHKIKTLIFSSTIFSLMEIYSIFSEIKGISYFGIDKNLKAITLIFIFEIISPYKISNKYIKRFLRNLTNYTGGVFYLHYTVYLIFKNFIKPIERCTFLGCVIVYFLCYLLCLIGVKISRKSKIKNLFI